MRYMVLVFVAPEYELYAAFEPLIQKRVAQALCQRLTGWIKANHAALFVPL